MLDTTTGPDLVSLGVTALREALDPEAQDPGRARLVAAFYVLDRGALPSSPERELARMLDDLDAEE